MKNEESRERKDVGEIVRRKLRIMCASRITTVVRRE